MSIQVMRDLKGLLIQVIHAPDADGKALVEHLRRIGCNCEAAWPLPEMLCPQADVVLISIDQENRQKILKLVAQSHELRATLIAVASYEDPSTLQIILECGALAVIERPVRPFGMLTNLTLARSLWLQQQDFTKRIRKLERKISGGNRIIKAKSILMETQKLSEQEAYENIRRQAMAKRISMDDLASSIINAYELLSVKM